MLITGHPAVISLKFAADENQKSVRVYMADGREIEGVSLGVDACQVTLAVGTGEK